MVYQAKDENLGRRVALRIPSPEWLKQAGHRDAFLQEGRAAAALHHPNIATIYEIDEVDGVPFLATEWIEGKSLRILLAASSLKISDTLRLGAGIAAGLERAHRAGLVHRALNPGNVVIGSDGQPKILDFGIAGREEEWKSIGSVQATRSDATTAGIPTGEEFAAHAPYVSPELVRGGPVDARSDLFSFGILLYEMATGKTPFRGSHPAQVISGILNDMADSVSSIRSDVPDGLERIIGRCMEKNPGRRHQQAAEIVSELEFLKKETVPWGGRPVSRIGSRKRRKRYKTLQVAGLAAAVAILAGLFIWRLLNPWALPTAFPDRIAVFPFTVRGDPELEYLGEGMVTFLGRNLDGAGTLRSVDPHGLLGLVRQAGSGNPGLDGAPGIARQLQAGRFVLGEILATGGRIEINAHLYEISSRPREIARSTAAGNQEEFSRLVGELSAGLVEGILPGDAPPRGTDYSFQALKEFITGENLRRQGRNWPAVQAFQRAIEAEPDFALAHLRLAWAAWWAPRREADEIRRAAIRRARELEAELEDPDRLFLEIWVELLEYDFEKARGVEHLLRRLLADYPNHLQGRFLLADTLWRRGRWNGGFDAARTAAERVFYLEPGWKEGLLTGLFISIAQGDAERSIELSERLMSLFPDGEGPMNFRAIFPFRAGDPAGQVAILGELERENDFTVRNTAYITAMMGDYQAGIRIAEVLTDLSRSPGWRAEGYGVLAHLNLATGQWSAAMRDLDEYRGLQSDYGIGTHAILSLVPVLPFSKQEGESLIEEISGTGLDAEDIAFLTGILSARLIDFDRAEKAAAELASLQIEYEGMGSDGSLGAIFAREYGHTVRAEIALRRGNPAEALAKIEKIRLQDLLYTWRDDFDNLFASFAYTRYLRAFLLEANGQLEEALEWYEPVGQTAYVEVVYRAPKHLRMGEVYEKLGKTEKAVKHFRRFVELWKDCDPELRHLVENAEARIARLEDQK